MAIGAFALTDLTTLRQALRMVSLEHDPELERRIDLVTDRFERFTNRKLKARTYKPTGAGAGEENLLLNGDDRLSEKVFLFTQYPINSITALTIKDKDLADPQVVDVTKLAIDNTVLGRVVILEDGRTWRLGTNNIEMTWNAGFAAIPDDLEELCIKQVIHEFLERDRSREGIQSLTAAGESVTYAPRNLLLDVEHGLGRYKRMRFA